MKKSFEKIIAKIPGSPGVYKYLDDQKDPLYIGKAKNLKKRVQSYFRKSAKHSLRISKMIEQVNDIKFIETNNEVEALILEDNLVKELQPKYNILLRDDKNFQYIKVTVDSDYPEVYTVRRITKDGARYFGPKTSGSDVKRLLETVKRVFKLCSVKNISVDHKGTPLKEAKVAVKIGASAAKRPCLDYHIKRCVGPCAGIVTPEEYRILIDQAIEFLEGNYKPAVEMIKKQMREFANEKKFERAAKLRDHILAIERSTEKQLITDTEISDRDVIAFVQDLGKSFFNLFQIRSGRLISQENFVLEGSDEPAEIMETFLRDYYAMAADIPREVLISIEVEKPKLLQDYIRKFTNKATQLIHPQAGRKDDLVMLAEKNARSFAQQNRARWMADKKEETALKELKEVLKLESEPKRIECYDISHLSGTETVGSMAVFKKGLPASADYRQFRLKVTQGIIDDYKSMGEVIRRRLNYLPDVLPEKYKLRKATKKDFDAMIKIAEKIGFYHEDWEPKQFYLIEKKKEIVGFCRGYDLSEKVYRIAGLWVNDKERGTKLGYHLLKKVIERSKAKRLYLMCHPELEDYYVKFGFEVLRDSPKDLKDLHKKFEKNAGKKIDVLFVAYQKKKRDFSFESRPDLIVIDGGKGQLHAAHDVLFEKGLQIPMIALAKRAEEVFIPGKSDPINLPADSEASYLLQRIRDEAHRFAIEYNRSSRDKKMIKSALDRIPGVGPKLKKKLLTYFGSVQKIREAPQVVLEQVAGEGVAKKIKEGL